jgi:hypothetical protein
MLAEAFFAKWRSLSRYFSAGRSLSAANDLDIESKLSDVWANSWDISERYREYLLDQLSLHFVNARLLGVIAFCPRPSLFCVDDQHFSFCPVTNGARNRPDQTPDH